MSWQQPQFLLQIDKLIFQGDFVFETVSQAWTELSFLLKKQQLQDLRSLYCHSRVGW